MPAGKITIEKFMKELYPKKGEELYCAIALFAGVFVSWMFLKKKNEKIEGLKNKN